MIIPLHVHGVSLPHISFPGNYKNNCICSVLRTEQIPRGVPVPPASPPGEERSPGKGNPFPESPTRRRRRFPASKRHRRPGANPSPILRERFGVSFRFTVHAAETDHNRREIPPIPPRCCHTFVLLHTATKILISAEHFRVLNRPQKTPRFQIQLDKWPL